MILISLIYKLYSLQSSLRFCALHGTVTFHWCQHATADQFITAILRGIFRWSSKVQLDCHLIFYWLVRLQWGSGVHGKRGHCDPWGPDPALFSPGACRSSSHLDSQIVSVSVFFFFFLRQEELWRVSVVWGVIGLVGCYTLTHLTGPKLPRDRWEKTIIFSGVKKVIEWVNGGRKGRVNISKKWRRRSRGET